MSKEAPHPEGGGREMSGERNRILVGSEVSRVKVQQLYGVKGKLRWRVSSRTSIFSL